MALLIRLAFIENHQRTDRKIALRIGDVETLNPLGRILQLQGAAQAVERFFFVLLTTALLNKTMPRVFLSHFDPAEFITTLRTQQGHSFAFALGQEFGPHVGIFQDHR